MCLAGRSALWLVHGRWEALAQQFLQLRELRLMSVTGYRLSPAASLAVILRNGN